MTVTFEQAKELLAGCTRSELRDHAFGDREIYWSNAADESVGSGYSGSSGAEVAVGDSVFHGEEAEQLVVLGTIGKVERNDSTGPDEFEEGECMPGLTLEGVRKELEGE